MNDSARRPRVAALITYAMLACLCLLAVALFMFLPADATAVRLVYRGF